MAANLPSVATAWRTLGEREPGPRGASVPPLSPGVPLPTSPVACANAPVSFVPNAQMSPWKLDLALGLPSAADCLVKPHLPGHVWSIGNKRSWIWPAYTYVGGTKAKLIGHAVLSREHRIGNT